jgi:hypothetical protein
MGDGGAGQDAEGGEVHCLGLSGAFRMAMAASAGAKVPVVVDAAVMAEVGTFLKGTNLLPKAWQDHI